MTSKSALIVLIDKFVNGEDVSVNSAKAIEAALDDAFADDEKMQDIVQMLASYRPGGGSYLFDENQVSRELCKVLSYLKKTSSTS
jgi:hypothetical protein